MQRRVILHQMTAMTVAPVELPALAASTGCREISLFTHVPGTGLPEDNTGFVFPLVTPAMRSSMLAALANHDISVSGVEFFPIAAEIDVEDFAPALALGRELGARRAVTLIFDHDSARALDKLGRLCHMAAAEELSVGLEFTPLSRGCPSLGKASWFVDQLGRDRLGIGVDTLHLVRSGGTPADLMAMDPGYFLYAQICDGQGNHFSSDYFAETHNRAMPGDGDFPLLDILNSLPAPIALEVEVPSEDRWNAGASVAEHARDAVKKTQGLIERLNPWPENG